MSTEVVLREVVMRDGLQSLGNFIPTESKIKIIDKILKTGIKEIECTSFVSHRCIPQLKDSSELVALLPKTNKLGVVYSALVPNLKGAAMALSMGIEKLVVVVSASDSHNQINIGRSVRQSLSELKEIFTLIRGKNVSVVGSIAVAFGCPYKGTVAMSDVLRIAETYMSLGASSLILADTIGIATQNHVAQVLTCFQRQFPLDFLTLHLHNNHGKAMENLLTALDLGVFSFDTALAGIGGCPYVPAFAGNLSTESVAKLLKNMNIDTGIDMKKLDNASNFLMEVIAHRSIEL